MQIVINMNDGTYEAIKNEYCASPPQKGLLKILWDAVKDGTPLPKGHGRLIDADAINLKDISPVDGFSVYGATAEDIDLTPTIIEADRSEDKE